MKTPAGKECAYFYGDYYRGRNVEECRLLKAQGQAWSRDLCATCPVPSILQANSCPHLSLKTKLTRPLTAVFQRRVQVSAYCEKVGQDVAEPHIGCGQCHGMPINFVIKE